MISRDILQAGRFHVAHVYADIHAHISGRHTAHHGETRAKTRVGMQKCDSPVRPTTAGLFARVLVTSDKGQPLKKNAVSLTSSSAHSGVRQTNCTRRCISIVSLTNLPLSACRVTTRSSFRNSRQQVFNIPLIIVLVVRRRYIENLKLAKRYQTIKIFV